MNTINEAVKAAKSNMSDDEFYDKFKKLINKESSMVGKAIERNSEQEIPALFCKLDDTLPCPACDGEGTFDAPSGQGPDREDAFNIPCRKCGKSGRVNRELLTKEELQYAIEVQNRNLRRAIKVAVHKLTLLKSFANTEDHGYHYQVDDALKVLEEAA